MQFNPIMRTDDRSPVSGIQYSGDRGVLVAVSKSGDTYQVSSLPDNAMGNGPRTVFGRILDGNGNLVDALPAKFILELYRAVASVMPAEVFNVVASVDAWAAKGKTRAVGTYVSRVLSVGDDFGHWNEIFWTQTCHDSRVVVAVKSGQSVEEVEAKDWEKRFEEPCQPYYGASGTFVSKSLDYFNLRGPHMMFKIDLETELADAVPQVREMGVSYTAQHSVYFFTSCIRIDGSSFGTALLTASVTQPKKTQVSFGIGPGGSTEWKDYKVVEPDRLASVPDAYGKRMRVGIRFGSLDTSATATVHEFALSFSSDKDDQLNKEGEP